MLLTTSRALINILQYHRDKEDLAARLYLECVLRHMLDDNVRMMQSKALRGTDQALRFLELHGHARLFEAVWRKLRTKHVQRIPDDAAEMRGSGGGCGRAL